MEAQERAPGTETGARVLGACGTWASHGLLLEWQEELEGERSCGKQSQVPGGTGNSAAGPGMLTSCLAWHLFSHIFGSDTSSPSSSLDGFLMCKMRGWHLSISKDTLGLRKQWFYLPAQPPLTFPSGLLVDREKSRKQERAAGRDVCPTVPGTTSPPLREEWSTTKCQ